jgi:SSS family solute:Na+ symporter
MIQELAPEVLGGLLAAGVFAAIMSSLDSQVLSIGNMFTQDVVGHYILHDVLSDRAQLIVGRVFVILVLGVTFGLSLISDKSIFSLGIWSFTGYAALMPILVAALYWRRSTKWGALASLLVTSVLWIFFFFQGWRVPDYSLVGGLMPVVVIFGASCLALIRRVTFNDSSRRRSDQAVFSDRDAFSEE